MKTIQRIGILFLLLVFLFGTTGLSVFHHFCQSSNLGNVTLYPEIFHSSGSSCCEDESATGYACAGHEAFKAGLMSHTIDAAPCCKSTSSLFKLGFQQLQLCLDKIKSFVLRSAQLIQDVAVKKKDRKHRK